MITSLGCLQNDLKWIIKKNEVFLVKLFWSMTLLYQEMVTFIKGSVCVCVSVRWNWCFMLSKQLSYVMANSSVNRCPMQRKNSLPEMRFAPWTANSHCISDRCWPCIALSMGAWQKTKLKVDENKNHDRIPWSQLIKIVSNYFRSECLST